VELRRLGNSGPIVSAVGVGCNNFGTRLDERQVRAVVDAALTAGITHFDTAESYGSGQSEILLGKALGSRRDEAVIATKFSPRPAGEAYRPGALRKRILETCDGSLRRLSTDRIDLYYQHRPDSEAPAEEALEALAELAAAGKVVHGACSNFSTAQIEEAARAAATEGYPGFVASQIHWNLLFRDEEEEHIPAARRHGHCPVFPAGIGTAHREVPLRLDARGIAFGQGAPIRWARHPGELRLHRTIAPVRRGARAFVARTLLCLVAG